MKPLGTYKLPVGAEDCGQKKNCKSGVCVRHGKRIKKHDNRQKR